MIPGDLDIYRNNFIAHGVSFPLHVVTFDSLGAVNNLPTVESKTGWPWTEETDPDLYDSSFSWPKLTIVTPSYNQGAFIEQTIRSVLLQNYPNLEYIIIDGGSTDNTIDIIKKYSPWLSFWQSEKDNGQSHAINLGFSLASGEYRAWINSDDYYLKNVFHTVVEKFLSAKVNFVYGYGYNYHVKTDRFELIKINPLLDYFIRIPSLVQPSCFWNKSIHQPVNEGLQCSLDYELWLRLVKGQSRKMIRKPLSVANVHADAKTSDPKMKVAWDKDHLYICSPDAHGPVYDWNKRVFLHKIYNRLNNLIYNVIH
jgi:glycosyltransferase involved in cell wall biosynthesis